MVEVRTGEPRKAGDPSREKTSVSLRAMKREDDELTPTDAMPLPESPKAAFQEETTGPLPSPDAAPAAPAEAEPAPEAAAGDAPEPKD